GGIHTMKTFRFAAKQILPVLFSYIFIGIAFGVLIHQAGYSAPWAFFASFFIYAGSMQIVMIPLMLSGVPLSMLAIMTFFVNGRHIFYGLGFIDQFRKMGWKYPYMALTLTDEVYSVLCSAEYPEDVDARKADFLIALMCHMLWAFCSGAGALLGQTLPIDTTGIEFSAAAFFITVCVNHWRQLGSHIPSIVGLAGGVGFLLLLGADKFLLPALITSLILLIIFKDTIRMQMGEIKNDD
ncbi:MAG: AzlC family ABC transporter permease, partial [Bacillota bacterium]